MDRQFNISFAKGLDEKDSLSTIRSQFSIPQFNQRDALYFTGHSLGLQFKNHAVYLNQELDDWKNMGVEGHFHAKTPWFDYHQSLTNNTASIVGAKNHEVVTMNALSVNLHLLLISFYQPKKTKYKVLCESNLFPSDLYILQSQIKLRGYNPDEAIVFLPANSHGVIQEDELYNTIEKHKNELALIFIGGVNYYTGQVFDMQSITQLGHRYGITVGFDLAHAVGNIDLQLHHWKVDFAAWCSYKYLNSGPGNVSTVFIHENQLKKEPFRLSGWWGHKVEDRFMLQKKFQPVPTAEGWQLSNAPVFGMAIYRSSLELFMKVGLSKLIKKRVKLSHYLEDAIQSFNQHSKTVKIGIITPGAAEKRGAQLSLSISHKGQELYHALKQAGVYVDWREPNVMRLAVVPLYNSFEDIAKFYHILFKCI
tara:strand:- start:61 stop:1326 length:1266 start_codon:yes stop_codon:yes gene_type:complete